MEKYLINPNQKLGTINKNIYGHFVSTLVDAFTKEFMLLC